MSTWFKALRGTLDRIGDSFGQILDGQTFAVFSFEEELAMGGKKVCMEYMPYRYDEI